jgi:hypothetical protein
MPPTFSAALITRFQNEAEEIFAREFPCLIDRISLDIVSGTSIYTLPSYIIDIRKITWKGKRLAPLSHRRYRENFSPSSSGTPEYYIHNNIGQSQIKFLPSPNETIVSSTSNLWGSNISSKVIVEYYRAPSFSSALDGRINYLTYLSDQGYAANRAILFTEGTGTPKEYYTNINVTLYDTPGWTTVNGHTAGRADSISDQWSLATSSDFLGTTKETIFIIRKKADVTPIRESQLFGVNAGSSTWCGAHVPWSTGEIFFDWGTARTTLTSISSTTNVEAWLFKAGPSGKSIWLNGINKKSVATVTTRSASSAVFKINGGGSWDAGEPQDILFFAAVPDEVPDAICATFTEANVFNADFPLGTISIPSFIRRRLLNAYVYKCCYAVEGRTQNLKASKYWNDKWVALKEQYKELLAELVNQPRRIIVGGKESRRKILPTPVLPYASQSIDVEPGE